MFDETVRTWAEIIVQAALEDRDIRPLVDLARRGGADLDALHRLASAVYRAIRESAIDPDSPHESGERLLSADDFVSLRALGIRD